MMGRSTKPRPVGAVEVKAEPVIVAKAEPVTVAKVEPVTVAKVEPVTEARVSRETTALLIRILRDDVHDEAPGELMLSGIGARTQVVVDQDQNQELD